MNFTHLFLNFLLVVPGDLAPVQQTATAFLIEDDQDEGSIFPLSGVSQILLMNDRLYIRSARDPKIAILSLKGRVIDLIGRDGEGPGEFTYGVWSMGAEGKNLWVLGHTRRNKLQYFKDHQFQAMVPVALGGNPGLSMSANGLAVHGDQVVVPVWPNTGFVAAAYQADGTQKLFGELLFSKDDVDIVRQVPMVNDTMWLYHKGFFYCLFKYQSVVRKYDEAFGLVKSFTWSTPAIEDKINKVYNPDGGPKRKPEILFTDFKVSDQKIYVMGQGSLHRLDLESGDLDQVISFYIERAEKRWRHHFHCFELLSPTEILLGHFFGDPTWLWTAALPV